jgi:TonB family protein
VDSSKPSLGLDNPKKVTIALSCIAMLLALWTARYFLHPAKQNELKSVQPALGFIREFNPPVTFRRSQELVWSDASKGVPLFAFDAVQTQKNAQARITLFHQSELELGAESLVILDPSALGLGSQGDHTVLREGELKGETERELWILTSAALIQMSPKVKGHVARAVVSLHEGQKLNVQLTEGTGRVFRHKASNKPSDLSPNYEEIVLEPGHPIVLDAPVPSKSFGEKTTDWGPALPKPSVASKPSKESKKERHPASPMIEQSVPLEKDQIPPQQELAPSPAPSPAPTTKAPGSAYVPADSDETDTRKINLLPIESKNVGTDYKEGLTKEQLEKVIHEHSGEVVYCYKSALVHTPDLEGSMVVSFVISGQGGVKNVEVKKGTSDPELDRCVSDRLSTWKFPPPPGGLDDKITYPITFNSPEK